MVIRMEFRERAVQQRIGIPRRFWGQSHDPVQEVRAWVDDFDLVMWEHGSESFGKGLALCGRDSSASAAWVLQRLIDGEALSGSDLLFRDWGSFVDDLMGDEVSRSALVRSLTDPHVLVLDHIPVLGRKEWLDDVLTRVLKSRYDNGTPTIITSAKPVDIVRAGIQACIDFDPHCLRFVETLGSEG